MKPGVIHARKEALEDRLSHLLREFEKDFDVVVVRVDVDYHGGIGGGGEYKRMFITLDK